jgi:hypothetical protein
MFLVCFQNEELYPSSLATAQQEYIEDPIYPCNQYENGKHLIKLIILGNGSNIYRLSKG